MNEKITLQDLVVLLVEKHGMLKKDADALVRGIFELIEEALSAEKYVKIKGLGTFKLTEVDSRESMNVNTGERIEIQGHTKISFTPDTAMKELINKPFSHFDTVILNDGVNIEDIIFEEPQMLEETDVVEQQEEMIAEEPAVERVEEILEEVPVTEEIPTIVEISEPVVEEQTEVLETPSMVIEGSVEETRKEQQPEIIEEILQTEFIEKPVKAKNSTYILWGIIVVLVLIILLGCYWMFFRSSVSDVATNLPEQGEVLMSVEDTVLQDTVEALPILVAYEKLSAEELKNERVPSIADTLEYRIVGTKTLYTLQNGETIIRASVKFFGTKKFWPYIVKHNQDILKDADHIPAGIEIKIPELTLKD